jgi:hypothetical protein
MPISFIRFMFCNRDDEYISVPVLEGIPDDAALVMVIPSPERDAIGLKFLHESFEPVLEGNCFPEVALKEMTFKRIPVAKQA